MLRIQGQKLPSNLTSQQSTADATNVDGSPPTTHNHREVSVVEPKISLKLTNTHLGLDKNIDSREASFFCNLQLKTVSDLFWNLKHYVQSTERNTENMVNREFHDFASPDSSLVKELNTYDGVTKFLNNSDYAAELNELSTALKELDSNEKFYTTDSCEAINKMLAPDISTNSPITNLVTLKSILAQKGINLSETTNGEELDIKLSNENLEDFKSTPLARCLRLYTLLGGLSFPVKNLEAASSNMDQSQIIKTAIQLKKVQDLTIGLCHSLLKAQMPDLYNDDTYTPIKVTDEQNKSYFRSDIIQPRAGWMDTPEAIQIAKEPPKQEAKEPPN